MTSTTSIKDVRQAFEALRTAVAAAGITQAVRFENYNAPQGTPERYGEVTLTAENLRMQEGSPTYGRAFRLYFVGPHGAHYNTTPFSEYLGWTRAEAEDKLRGIAQGIYAAREAAPTISEDLITRARAAVASDAQLHSTDGPGDSGDVLAEILAIIAPEVTR
jgi:hypothetical protein